MYICHDLEYIKRHQYNLEPIKIAELNCKISENHKIYWYPQTWKFIFYKKLININNFSDFLSDSWQEGN